ncbi:MAG: PSD1 and planctomycete cytochrome C domain-containing protein [Saprospiraceae bacterium]|nr:PSD1 and planctomycete cytochrome C domain-containing protein [Saprospiraceae bacterium]MCF8248498.1 PSD1 and planctomycete cytochrome C domain-containing protein [Saprospiraceae bacterium]MCF8310232.1 PSD1 and planctomycete cytochrome C domain-containing protein [Saprospiraceae bacterium]MCF8439329.1 PSD1 and planctomycete cytochrome C domain-containing protein [Saprospiraceae bacterium]
MLVVCGVILASGFLFPAFFSSDKTAELPDVVDFNYHIKPIISDRCFKCHGPDKAKQEQELGLNTEAGFFKTLKEDSTRHVVVPGKPELSELYRRIMETDPEEMMPPPESNLSLTDFEKALIKKWIEQGAKYKQHWAFIPPTKPNLPKVKNKDWAKGDIDLFILQKLENEGFKPNDEADRERLLRRTSYDLTGLPPAPALLDRFLADKSPNAFEKMVDTLLALPSYGEHQASHWLDLARYADSHGYQDDSYRSQWPWRDWVIHAFNENLPYDQFVTWQLAGDLLPSATKEQILATGFCRNHKITQEGGVIEDEYRVEYIADKTNLYATAFLGLTMECAKCHDHKYDPVSQEEYFSTYAFFNQNTERGFYGDVSNVSIAEQPTLSPTKEELAGILSFINHSQPDSVVSMVMAESDTLRKTYLLKRGQYDQPDKAVAFGTPKAVLPFPETLPKNRLGLAQWTFSKENPLAARVVVNRVWQQLFGVGLVKSVENFGSQGELPTHPELLDWLAVDFQESGWGLKQLIKKIVTSAAYRQSAAISTEKQERDPENRFVSRGPRFRMTPEMIRDTWLVASGLLNPMIGGPSVRPYQPGGLWEETNAGDGRGTLTRYVQDKDEKLYRRTMYTIFKRTLPHPFLTTFDASYRDVCAVKRQRTNTPLQALNLMNDPLMLEASRTLAQKLLKASDQSLPERLSDAFRQVASRQPSARELAVLEKHFTERKTELAKNPDMAKLLLTVGDSKPDDKLDAVESAALMETLALVFNMDEVICK